MGYDFEEKAIAIAPKFTAVLSILGSGCIILHQIQKRRTNTKANTQLRLLLGMSICDVLVSACFFFGTWAVPSWEPVYGASGNQATCTAQGFFSQFSLATAMYNGSLSIYYLAKIKFGWTDKRIQSKLEPWLHLGALSIATITSVAGLFLKLYNNDSWECWISPSPMDCTETWKMNKQMGDPSFTNETDGNMAITTNHTTAPMIPCVRGDNASAYRWILYYAWLWAAILLVTINMVLVYRSVLATEKANERYNIDMTRIRERKLSKKVATQGYWYCGAFYATWIFPTITRIVQVSTGGAPFWLVLLTAIFVPVQGFFNFIVYIHPRYETLRQEYTTASQSRSDASSTLGRLNIFSRVTTSITSAGRNSRSLFSRKSQEPSRSSDFETNTTLTCPAPETNSRASERHPCGNPSSLEHLPEEDVSEGEGEKQQQEQQQRVQDSNNANGDHHDKDSLEDGNMPNHGNYSKIMSTGEIRTNA